MVLNTDGAVQSHNRNHKMEPLPSRENCYDWKRGTCIYEWMIVVILVKTIPEEGSGRWKDDTVCNQMLFIFQDQGNISKGRRRTQKLPRGPLCKYATSTAMLKELVVFATIKF